MSGPMCGNCVYFNPDYDAGEKLDMGTCDIKDVRSRRRTAINHFCHLHDYRQGRHTKTVLQRLVDEHKTRVAQ